MKRNKNLKNGKNGNLGAALSATLLASMIMAGSATAAPPIYDDYHFITPNTEFDDQEVVVENGAELYPGMGGGSLHAGRGYNLKKGLIDGVSLNDGPISGTLTPANLRKTTFDSVRLIGDSHYTGATTISAGTLYLGDGERNARLLGTTSVEVNVGGTLAIDIGDNTFSLPEATSFTLDGGLSVINVAGQTTTLIDINATGGADSYFGVGSHSETGSGTTILVNSNISANRHIITAGTEVIDQNSSIHANEIVLQSSLYDTGTPILDVDGGSVASLDGTGRSDIKFNDSNARVTIRNNGTVRGNITADHPSVTDVVVNISAGGSLDGSIDILNGQVSVFGGEIVGGHNISVGTGLISVHDAGFIDARNISLGNATLGVSADSAVNIQRNVTIENGDFLADGLVTVSRNIQIDTGNLDSIGGDITADWNIRINNGDLIATDAAWIKAGRNITVNGKLDLLNSTLEAGTNGFGRITLNGQGESSIAGSYLEADRFNINGGWLGVIDSSIDAPTTIRGGVLYLDEDSTIYGRTVVREGGAAWIEGTIDGNLRLTGGSGFGTGGLLAGSQVTITGDFSNNGTIATLELGFAGEILVGGDFYQRAGGTFAVGVYGQNNYDKIIVDGSATIEGGELFVLTLGYKPRRDDKLRIIEAAGGVNLVNGYNVQHNFATDTMLRANVRYTDDAVEVFFDQLKFAGEGKTPNQRAVGRALDHAAKRGQLDSLFEHLNYTSRKNISRLLQRLSPEGLTAIFNIGFANAQTQNINIERRLDDVRDGSRGFSANGLALRNNRGTINFDGAPIINERDGLSLAGFDGKTIVSKETVAPIVETSPWGFFITGTGEWADIETTHEATGGDFASGGVTVGADYRVNDNFVVGLFGGYVHTSSDMANGGDIKANGGRLGLYGSYFNDGFYVNALASGGYNHYKINRDTIGGTARGKTDGGQFDTLLGAGYDFSLGCVTLGPVGSLQYSYVGFDGYNEHGSDARLNVAKNNQDSLRTLLGAKLATSWNIGGMVLRPEVRAQWKHEYLDRSGAIDSSFTGSGALFTVHGPKVGRDSLVVDAGASLDVSETFSVYAYYTGELARQNYSSNSVNGGFRISF